MQVDLVAEQRHYYDHLLPIWNALPAEIRGVNHGVTGDKTVRLVGDTLLTAGYSDVIRYPTRPVIYVEHGAGQSYVGLPREVTPFYSPLTITKQHRNVVAFICPNDEVAARWAGSYDCPTFVVGCPKLDPWHAGLRDQHEPRTVAITFHWEPPASVLTAVPELRSGFEIYWPVLAETIKRFVEDGYTILCHAHPKATALQDFWRQPEIKNLSVEIVESSELVTDRAGLIIADNTSLQAEFLSLGRRVVYLNHPAYRRDVSHGGRFWQWPEKSGVQLDTPASLVALDLDSIPASTWHPYAFADGMAAERAATAILSLLR